jgi:hypothetical protein
MIECDERKRLQQSLTAAFEKWYEFKEVAGKERQAREAERKVHHIQRALGEHYSKHGCNCDSD